MSDQPTCSRYVGERMAQQSSQNEPLLPLEALLGSVTVWHPTRLCGFICKIMQQFEPREKEYEEFINTLDTEARDQGVLGRQGDWKFVMDSEDKKNKTFRDDGKLIPQQSHCYFLTTTYNKNFSETKIEYKETAMQKFLNLSTMEDVQTVTKSVFKLLKYMRNKIEHFKDFPPKVQKALGWGIEKDNRINFNDCLFVNYWSLRFPELFLFIWREFYKKKDELGLSAYYPPELTMHMPKLNTTLPEFVTNLNTELHHHMKNRGLHSYYINQEKNMRLEFRHLSSPLQLATHYEGSSEVYIRVSSQGMNTVFKKAEEISVSHNFRGNRKSLAIMAKLAGLGVESDYLQQCIDCERIIVLVHNPEDKDRVLPDIEKICNLKFRKAIWDDLNNSEKNIVVNRFVQVKGKYYKLCEILPERFNKMQTILSSLDEDELQNLLQNSVPTVFSKCILPEVDVNYMERSIVQNNNGLDVVQQQLELEQNWIAQETKNPKLMCLCDTPGHGKTSFTSRVANKTSMFLVLHLTATKLAMHLRDKTVDKDSLIDIFTMIFCFSSFENGLFEALMTRKIRRKNVLILIDALDEAGSKSVEPILNALTIIRNDFQTVQVFVTMRVYLFNQTIEQLSGATYYRLSSFSDKDKIEYLTQYWDNYINDKRKKDANSPAPTQKQLTEFAGRCTEIRIPEEFQDVLGVPLQCRMIAEIYAENVRNGNFSIDINDFGNVKIYFEKFLDSKCEIYCREKLLMLRGDLVDTSEFSTKRKKMDTLHIYYALKYFYEDDFTATITMFKKDFLPLFDKDTETQVLNFGIIKTLEPLEFMHLLIAEYFVALFYKKLANNDGIYHSMFSQYKQEYKWQFNQMLGLYLTGSTRYDESMNWSSFELKRPTVFKFLKCLSEEQSNSVVDPRNVYPTFNYNVGQKFISYFKNAVSKKYKSTRGILSNYLTGLTTLGKRIHGKGFPLFDTSVWELVDYAKRRPYSAVNCNTQMCLYRFEDVALQKYHDLELLPDFVYTKIIEMLNVVQRLWSTTDFCRLKIHVTENGGHCEIHVHVEHIK